MQLDLLNRKNFKYQEFFLSKTAIAHNIDNQEEFLSNPRFKEYLLNGIHLSNQLQLIRDKMNASNEFKEIVGNDMSININSGFRCQKLNNLVGGRPNSQHTRFEAVDFRINGINEFEKLKEIAVWIKKQKIIVDQCLVEASWIHLSCKIQSQSNRMMFGTFTNNIFTAF